jgi:hypothetical protein
MCNSLKLIHKIGKKKKITFDVAECDKSLMSYYRLEKLNRRTLYCQLMN